jgi:hypothetical protein
MREAQIRRPGRLRTAAVVSIALVVASGCSDEDTAREMRSPTTDALRTSSNKLVVPATTTTSAPRTVQDLCAAGERLDADGDGRIDHVYIGEVGADAAVVLCAANGNVAAIPFSTGYLEAGNLFVLNRDDPAIFIGEHTAVSSGGGELLTFADDRIQPVVDTTTWEPVGVADGFPVFDEHGPARGDAWGCLDVDGDGRRELVQVAITAHGWTRAAYSIDGTRAHQLADTSGSLEGGDSVQEFTQRRGATLAPPC